MWSLTIITRVNPLSQEEAAELVLSMHCVLDLHQVGCHAERIVLQVALTLLSTTGNKKSQIKPNQDKSQRVDYIQIPINILTHSHFHSWILDFKMLNTRGQGLAIFLYVNVPVHSLVFALVSLGLQLSRFYFAKQINFYKRRQLKSKWEINKIKS